MHQINGKMRSQYLGKASRPLSLIFLLHIFFLLFLSYGSSAASADATRTTIIGVVIDEDSRAGKDQKTAIKIAAQNLSSKNHELIFNFRNISSGNPLQAATSG